MKPQEIFCAESIYDYYYRRALNCVFCALTKEASKLEEIPEESHEENPPRVLTDEEFKEFLALHREKEGEPDRDIEEVIARDWDEFFHFLNLIYFLADILHQEEPEYKQAVFAVQVAIGLTGHKGESSLDLLSAIRKLATFPKEEIDAEAFAITFKARFLDLIRQFNLMVNGGVNPSYYEFYRILYLLRDLSFCLGCEVPSHLERFIHELEYKFSEEYISFFSPRDLRSDYGRHIAGKFNQIAMWLENL